jgi:hypothetical protein
MNKLKKEALKVIAANLPMDEITGLKEMFHSMDKDLRCAQMPTSTNACERDGQLKSHQYRSMYVRVLSCCGHLEEDTDQYCG